MKLKLITKLCIVIVFLFPLSGFWVVNNNDLLDRNATQKNALIAQLSPRINKYKIDGLQDWNSRVESRGNPILATLANYVGILDSSRTKRNLEDRRWAQEFYDANNGILMGVKSNKSISVPAFREAWDNTPASLRVFVSFASEDATLAQNIKKELATLGYKTFIYLDGEREAIKSAEDIAYYMQTAENCLVLDTKNARLKSGVLAEALSYAKYTHKVKSTTISVYGRRSCNRTKQVLKEFRKTEANVNYYDIDVSPAAASYLHKNKRYLENDLLPLVVVDGKPIKFSSLSFYRAVDKCHGPIIFRPTN